MGSELWLRGGGRCSEGFVIQRIEILAYRAWRISGINLSRRPILRIAGVPLLDIGGNQTRAHRKALTPSQTFLYATRNRRLEHMTQQVALAEPTMSILGKGRMIRDATHQIGAAKPAVFKVQCTSSQSRRSNRIPKQYPTSSIRISSSGSTEGRPV